MEGWEGCVLCEEAPIAHIILDMLAPTSPYTKPHAWLPLHPPMPPPTPTHPRAQALNEGSPSSPPSPLAALLPELDRFQEPPQVTSWLGTSPKSFPLRLKTSGR